MLMVLATVSRGDDGDQECPGRVLPQVGRDALARLAADAGADELDRHHEGQRQEHRPQHPGAELRASLGVGGDARRIVVGGARDHAGADVAQKGRDAVEDAAGHAA